MKKENNLDQGPFTVEKAIAYQQQHLAQWELVLKPEVAKEIWGCGIVVPVGKLTPSTTVKVFQDGQFIGQGNATGDWLPVVTQALTAGKGVTAQQVLGILGTFDLAKLRDDRTQAIHFFVEANRLAFADRSLYLGDPEFVPAPVAALLAPAYLRERAALISQFLGLPFHGDAHARHGYRTFLRFDAFSFTADFAGFSIASGARARAGLYVF